MRYLHEAGLPRRDETLQDPRCVFQIVRRHFARYTPEMVERVTGCPRDKFLEIADALARNSGPDRTAAFCYAVAWTQHTKGAQMIGCAALLQLLLGNIGRPGHHAPARPRLGPPPGAGRAAARDAGAGGAARHLRAAGSSSSTPSRARSRSTS